jgi:hypothetical protein
VNLDGGRAMPGPRFALAVALVAASFGGAACGGDDEAPAERPREPAAAKHERPAEAERGEQRGEQTGRKCRQQRRRAAGPPGAEPEAREAGPATVGPPGDERRATPVR